jgi:hypothetical protein
MICLCSLVVALGACSGGSESDIVQNVETVDTFSDGGGIVRTDVASSSGTITVLGLVPDLNAFDTRSGLLSIDRDSLPAVGGNVYGDFFEGTITVEGEVAQVLFYELSSNSAGILISDAPSGLSMLTLGPQPSSIPSGGATYVGTNLIVSRDGSGTFYESGTFKMNVDFATRTSSVNATTTNSSLSGAGIVIDAAEGRFSGSGLTLTVNGVTGDAVISGGFHGDGAAGVSGIYTQSTANPEFAGAIAGEKP